MKDNKKNTLETPANDVPEKTQTLKSKKKKKNSSDSSKDLSPLLLSIAGFLEKKGFSKSLNALKSEASIEELDGLEKHSADLEVIYYKYLEAINYKGKEIDNGMLDSVEKADTEKGEAEPELPKKSKEKKKKSKPDSEITSEKIVGSDDQEPSNNIVCKNQEDEPDRKTNEKKKKKTKPASKSIAESAEQGDTIENVSLDKSSTEDISSEAPIEEENLKPKDKKKKKTKLTSKKTEEVEGGDVANTDSKKEDVPTSEGNEGNIVKKDSKKRKRLDSEEKTSQPDDKIASKESKESKTEASQEDNKTNGLVENDAHAGKKRKLENGKHDKSGNKLGSAEPKTINAFRRVEIEKVEFVDDRLQDNSYWAKSGADSGYGAKAQEVLGQVRGRDFRHEKTKKKRGSYRGGLIDLQSHSVKFNYSDEE